MFTVGLLEIEGLPFSGLLQRPNGIGSTAPGGIPREKASSRSKRMHRNLTIYTVSGLGLVWTLALGTTPVSASSIADLASTYNGAWHSTTSAANENLPTGLTVLETSTNGKFTGFLGDQFIAGKVSSKGVITFKSQATRTARLQPQGIAGTATISKGKAQLSATGKFIVGTFSYKGTGGLASLTGKYLFSLGLPVGLAKGAEVGISAAPTDLATRYLGTAHNSTLAVTENLIFDLHDIVRSQNGNITAILGEVPMTGKVSKTGKVTVKGKRAITGGTFSAAGAGQLSATGRYFLGAIKSKGTGSIANQTGTFTFESTVPLQQMESAAGLDQDAPKLGSSN
jgi:hypothetical protein